MNNGRHRRWAVSLLVSAAAILLSFALLSRPAGLLASVGAIVWIVWRHDTPLGTCLPLLLLGLITVGILATLLYMLAMVHSPAGPQ